MFKFGSNNIGKVYLGSNLIGKAYLGSNLVYQGGPPAPPPPPPPPPYDAQVEYIATNGNQYIDLGMQGNAATFALYIDFQATTQKNQTRLIAANQQNAPCSIYVNGSNKPGYRAGSSWAGVAVSEALGTNRHTWLCDYFNLNNKVDGVDYAMAGSYTGTTNSNLLLCGPYTNQNKFIGRIYAAKIYQSGVLVLDLIPVRVGQEGKMYDLVNGNLYSNAGTGSYTYGNDITPSE